MALLIQWIMNLGQTYVVAQGGLGLSGTASVSLNSFAATASGHLSISGAASVSTSFNTIPGKITLRYSLGQTVYYCGVRSGRIEAIFSVLGRPYYRLSTGVVLSEDSIRTSDLSPNLSESQHNYQALGYLPSVPPSGGGVLVTNGFQSSKQKPNLGRLQAAMEALAAIPPKAPSAGGSYAVTTVPKNAAHCVIEEAKRKLAALG